MAASTRYRTLVKCPFCDASVDSRELADHARLSHAPPKEENSGPRPGRESLTHALGRHKPFRGLRKIRKPRDRSLSGSIDDADLLFLELVKSGTPVIRAHMVKGETGDPGSWTIWCPFCHAGVRPARLQKHLEKVHPDIAETGRDVRSAAGNAQKCFRSMHCPVCDGVINEAGFQEHLVNVHAMEIRLEKSRPRLVLPTIERAEDWIESGKILCPLCRAKLFWEDLGRHVENAHQGLRISRSRMNILKADPARAGRGSDARQPSKGRSLQDR